MNYPVIYIDDTRTLKEAIDILSGKSEVFIDLEFDKNHFRYGFNLCLMQIFDGEKCYLIDPLGNVEIERIFPILESPTIEKVCFAFGEDMRLLHHLGCKPVNILDLATVRSLLNRSTLSLSNSLVEELGKKPQISQQKSNWFERPLSADQIAYAVEDVIYLPELKQVLLDDISSLNRTEWVEQEKDLLSRGDWSEAVAGEIVPQKDRKLMTMREWIRYTFLMEFRDQAAQKFNRPAFKVIDKNVMLELAKNPHHAKEWNGLKGIHRNLRNDTIRERIEDLLRQAERSINEQGISAEQSSRPFLDKGSKLRLAQMKKRISFEKDAIFLPIKSEISKDLGEHLANFLLSNRRITGIIEGKIELLPYQKSLLNQYTELLKLPVSSALSED
ncbi:MAG: ribonuclease D [Brumimicrobium sp.]|nr:ribonuclease D [Brumimicrobium sp.]